MKTTTINTLATKFNITFEAVRKALEASPLTPVSELQIGKRTYKLYDMDAAEEVVSACMVQINKKRQAAADKRAKKLRRAMGATTLVDNDRLMVIEAKIDMLLETVNKLNESSLSAVEFA
jgi:hypothetical protein